MDGSGGARSKSLHGGTLFALSEQDEGGARAPSAFSMHPSFRIHPATFRIEDFCAADDDAERLPQAARVLHEICARNLDAASLAFGCGTERTPGPFDIASGVAPRTLATNPIPHPISPFTSASRS